MDVSPDALSPLVKVVGGVASAGAAIILTWKGRANWAPTEQDLPEGAERISGLLTGIGAALLWVLAAQQSEVGRLTVAAIVLALVTVAAFLVYGYLRRIFGGQDQRAAGQSNGLAGHRSSGTLESQPTAPALAPPQGPPSAPEATEPAAAPAPAPPSQVPTPAAATEPVVARPPLAGPALALSYLVLICAGSLALCCTALVIILKAQEPRFAVVMIDSYKPDFVFDPETRNAGKSNTFDIAPMLDGLPVASRQEISASHQWDKDKDNEVVAYDPDLIIVHLSSFYDTPLSALDSDNKFREFIGEMARRTRAKFLVYTRGLPADAKPEQKTRWQEQKNFMQTYVYKGRLQVFELPSPNASLRDPTTREAFRALIKSMLESR